jgi:hypothetical protein
MWMDGGWNGVKIRVLWKALISNVESSGSIIQEGFT